MIAPAAVDPWQSKFLEMLPAIRTRARIAFRAMGPEAREEAMSEVVARCCVDYCRLAELGKEDRAYPTVLADFAVRQVRSGRRVGTAANRNDVCSPGSQRRNGYGLCYLGTPGDQNSGGWHEMLVESKQAGPADTAASRIDFDAWLGSLSARDRGIAATLATGETTSRTAQRFSITPGRVSQLRRELQEAWLAFHGERAEEAA